jgi:formate dehydrogenase subunit gamma
MKVVRFTKTERLLHWSFTVPVLFLSITGITMICVSVFSLTDSVSKPDIVAYHMIAGFVLLVLPPLVFLKGDRKTILRNVREIMHIDREDWRWLKGSFQKMYKKGVELPECGKFNGGQKVNTILTMFIVLLLSSSGLAEKHADLNL